ncbi:MAG: hypothetical protein C5B52_09465 [Bacteroidetes bacterium]|nr:MAG: hypothetical protein C5B52_09465 [Bacteroidota bacterium]
MSENNNVQLNGTKENQQDFNLREFIYKYLRYMPLLILSVTIALIIGFIQTRYAIPIHRVTGTLFINKDNKYGGGSKSQLDEIFFSDNINLSNELEILHSRPLLTRVINNLGLTISYHNRGNLRSSNIYGSEPFRLSIISLKDSTRGFNMEIDARENDFLIGPTSTAPITYGQIFQTSYGQFILIRYPAVSLRDFATKKFDVTYTPIEGLASALSKAVKVGQANDYASILNISMETENVQLGKAIINNLMSEYGKLSIEVKREISQATMDFIDVRLDTIKRELGGVESNLLNYRESNEVIDLTAQSKLYYDKMEESSKGVNAQQVRMNVLDMLLNYLNNKDHQYEIVPTNLGIEEPVIVPMLLQYNAWQLQRDNYLKTTNEANPAVKNIETNLTTLREQIIEGLKNVRQSYQIAINKMQSTLEGAQRDVRSVPAKAKGLLNIERQQKIKQELYLFLLQKREEAAISAAATVASSRPLEDAIASDTPIKPDKKGTYLMALFLGLIIPIGIIFIFETFNDKLRTRDEIEKKTNVPIIGEIGHATEGRFAVTHGSRTVVAEQFRIARSSAHYLLSKIEKPVLLITSTVSGEGKSFIATNYGAVIALSGKKTIILEFDIRKPKILTNLGLKTGKGLTDYIVGNIKLDEIIQPIPEVQNLYIIGCGPVPPNPSELLLSEKVGELFQQLKERFDVIIVDTAPIGLVSDAMTLERYSDACFYIVRQNYSVKKQLVLIEDLYRQKKMRNMALIVNDIKLKGRYSGYYGYGSSYGYGYSYGNGPDYYEDGHKLKRNVFKRMRLFK